MYFDSLQEFIDMNGHGLYVWLSYGIFVLILLWNIWLVRASRSSALKLAAQSWRREDARQSSDTIEKSQAENDSGEKKS